jgi:hypothetical protein
MGTEVYILIEKPSGTILGVYSSKKLAKSYGGSGMGSEIFEYAVDAKPLEDVFPTPLHVSEAQERACTAAHTPPTYEELYGSITYNMDRFVKYYNAGNYSQSRIYARVVIQCLNAAKQLGYDYESLEDNLDIRIKKELVTPVELEIPETLGCGC